MYPCPSWEGGSTCPGQGTTIPPAEPPVTGLGYALHRHHTIISPAGPVTGLDYTPPPPSEPVARPGIPFPIVEYKQTENITPVVKYA